jgi:hypothetical protein
MSAFQLFPIMLTTLSTIKSRLAILDTETHRTLARTVALRQEFEPADTEILVP